MDKYTIFDAAGPATALAPASDDDSLAAAARRDLEAALQLLAERAQYLTGASGVSIALREDGEMVCRASAGRAAPEVGVEIETDSGLAAESILSRQRVCCDQADSDPRANRESCKELGVKSVMVVPLLREQEVVGIFELVADRASAFEDRDVTAVTRLAEMALTAAEYAEAAGRTLPEVTEAEVGEAPAEEMREMVGPARPQDADREVLARAGEQFAPVSVEVAKVGSCESCGFPVSQGRVLCVDCEQAGRSSEAKPPHLNALEREESWFQAHSYTLGALAVAALTLALLALKLR
jgi:putative methionine-R-sulfoxide reductase with GAF domain